MHTTKFTLIEAYKLFRPQEVLTFTADVAGTIADVFCQKGQTVTAGQILAAIQPSESSAIA